MPSRKGGRKWRFSPEGFERFSRGESVSIMRVVAVSTMVSDCWTMYSWNSWGL